MTDDRVIRALELLAESAIDWGFSQHAAYIRYTLLRLRAEAEQGAAKVERPVCEAVNFTGFCQLPAGHEGEHSAKLAPKPPTEPRAAEREDAGRIEELGASGKLKGTLDDLTTNAASEGESLCVKVNCQLPQSHWVHATSPSIGHQFQPPKPPEARCACGMIAIDNKDEAIAAYNRWHSAMACSDEWNPPDPPQRASGVNEHAEWLNAKAAELEGDAIGSITSRETVAKLRAAANEIEALGSAVAHGRDILSDAHARAEHFKTRADRLERERDEAARLLSEWRTRAIAAEGELAEARKALQEADEEWDAASEERHKRLDEARVEAEKWKSQDDMFGWNFHQGRAAGMNDVDICYRRVKRRIDDALGVKP